MVYTWNFPRFPFEGVEKMTFEPILIDDEFITLAQLLKLTTVISSGGMAKPFLAQYDVYLNGELEDRRGKKCYPGDEITIPELEQAFKVQLVDEA